MGLSILFPTTTGDRSHSNTIAHSTDTIHFVRISAVPLSSQSNQRTREVNRGRNRSVQPA